MMPNLYVDKEKNVSQVFKEIEENIRVCTIDTSSEVLVLVLVAESEPFKYTLWLCMGSGLSSG